MSEVQNPGRRAMLRRLVTGATVVATLCGAARGAAAQGGTRPRNPNGGGTRPSGPPPGGTPPGGMGPRGGGHGGKRPGGPPQGGGSRPNGGRRG
ncbi:hypothetical protein [Luteitalea sp.]|jgi:hypothetical protein|uniref:hypothetical protein n=1 Tax=Luteitalea sp. TaxID=2004800 RepID=UPI0037C639E1